MFLGRQWWVKETTRGYTSLDLKAGKSYRTGFKGRLESGLPDFLSLGKVSGDAQSQALREL